VNGTWKGALGHLLEDEKSMDWKLRTVDLLL
jgi:hypothetical protein